MLWAQLSRIGELTIALHSSASLNRLETDPTLIHPILGLFVQCPSHFSSPIKFQQRSIANPSSRSVIRLALVSSPALGSHLAASTAGGTQSDRGDVKNKKQSMADLKLRRLNELNSRLKEDLERPRIKVSEASMSWVPLPTSLSTARPRPVKFRSCSKTMLTDPSLQPD
ncbi:MAG: hypothetical protein Q9177_000372 [Variospora cf. flavescens]